MKTLYLKEHDVEELVSVPEVIDALDAAFRDQAAGRAWTNPRNRLRLSGSTLHMMAGAIPGYFGYKAYTVAAGKTQFFFFLYSAQTSEMLAMIEADTLGQRRTGAASGMATQYLLAALLIAEKPQSVGGPAWWSPGSAPWPPSPSTRSTR